MPERTAIERARRDERAGKAPSTQAGEFVREEIEHIREGKHGARSTEQAIAIGLSRARRAGVAVPAQGKRGTSKRGGAHTKKAARPAAKTAKAASATRSRAVTRALKREGHAAATPEALSVHAKKAARSRTASERSASARKAAETKGTKGRAAAARKAVRTRKRRLR
jgi:hypothetical protein